MENETTSSDKLAPGHFFRSSYFVCQQPKTNQPCAESPSSNLTGDNGCPSACFLAEGGGGSDNGIVRQIGAAINNSDVLQVEQPRSTGSVVVTTSPKRSQYRERGPPRLPMDTIRKSRTNFDSDPCPLPAKRDHVTMMFTFFSVPLSGVRLISNPKLGFG